MTKARIRPSFFLLGFYKFCVSPHNLGFTMYVPISLQIDLLSDLSFTNKIEPITRQSVFVM